MRKQARLVRLGFVLLWKNAVCWEIDDFELLLVDFGGLIAGCGRPLVKGSGSSYTLERARLRGRWGRRSRERG